MRGGGAVTVGQDNLVTVIALPHFTDKFVCDIVGEPTFRERILQPRPLHPDRDFLLLYGGNKPRRGGVEAILAPTGPRPLLVVAVNVVGEAFDMNPDEMVWVATQLVAGESGIKLPPQLMS